MTILPIQRNFDSPHNYWSLPLKKKLTENSIKFIYACLIYTTTLLHSFAQAQGDDLLVKGERAKQVALASLQQDSRSPGDWYGRIFQALKKSQLEAKNCEGKLIVAYATQYSGLSQTRIVICNENTFMLNRLSTRGLAQVLVMVQHQALSGSYCDADAFAYEMFKEIPVSYNCK
jgi:hypothetical protein